MICDAHNFIARLIVHRLQDIESELNRLQLEQRVLQEDIHLKHARENEHFKAWEREQGER